MSKASNKSDRTSPDLDTPTDMSPEAVNRISTSLNTLLADRGGEPIAVLCKATGLPKSALRSLWRSMRRPETEPDGQPSEAFERVLITYDMIATDRAQTVLRYWNWALSSALTPALVRAIRDGDDQALDEYSIPQWAAMLALAEDFGR